MLKTPSADLSDLVRILRFSGQYFTFEGRWSDWLRKLQYVRVVYLTLSAMLGYVSIFYGGVKETMGIELTYTILGTMTMCQQLHMLRYHKDTEEVVETIRNIRKQFQKGTDEEFQGRIRNVHIKVAGCYAFFTVTGIIMTMPPVIDVLILSWRTPVAFRLPMALGSLMDKEQTRNLKYFLIVMQSIGWMFTSMFTHLGIDAFLFISCYSYSSLVETFCRSLHLDPKLDSKQKTEYVRTIAAHHQALQGYLDTIIIMGMIIVENVIMNGTLRNISRNNKRLTHKVRLLFGFPYFFQNLIGSLVICSMLFVMTSGESTQLANMVSNGTNLVVILGIMTSTAFVGQKFTDQSAVIFDALYCFPWDELTPSDRSYFVLMIGAAREPFEIHFHGLMHLNLENFKSILNSSYSLLTFLSGR